MATFEYKAKKSPQEIVSGQIEADTQSGAIAKLSEMGLYPISLKESGQAESFDFEKMKLPLKWLIFFTREVADLLNSGVTLVKTLELISAQTHYHKLNFIARKVADKIKEGSNFSDSLKTFPGVFSPLYISVAKSGEISGTLEKVMQRLALYYEKNQQLKSKIVEALIYPAFLICMGILSVIVLTLFVIPKLIPMFEDMKMQLPFVTQIIIQCSHLIMTFWPLLLAGFLILSFLLIELFRNRKLHIQLQYLALKLPLLRDFVANRHFSETFQSLETLISNGIPALTALQISEESSTFHPFKESFKQIITEVTNGDSFSKSLETKALFPLRISTIIRVGEESGKLDQSMRKLAQNYTEAFEKSSNLLTKFAGPVFIILIAIFIGTIVVAMLLPILNINVNF